LTLIRWTNEAILVLARLREREHLVLFSHLDLVVEFPRMYPARQRGRFAGMRFFQIEKRWLVYYGVAADQVLIFDIVPSSARAE
jgi:plasmid stabilization system protein ParE